MPESQSTRHELKVSVVATPSGSDVDLSREMEMLRPALLYGDRVTLISPTLDALMVSKKAESLSVEDITDYLTLYYDLHGEPQKARMARDFLEDYRRVKRKGWRTTDSRIKLKQLEKLEQDYRDRMREIHVKGNDRLRNAGFDDLGAAIDLELLEIEDLTTLTEAACPDLFGAMWSAYTTQLIKSVTKPGAYPLIDEFSAQVVRAHISDGMLSVPRRAVSRGKQATLAAHLLDRLPTFPGASIKDIIDIRKELSAPLVRFRMEMVALSRTLEAEAFSEDFVPEANELAIEKIEPALLEIEELVHQNHYLRQFRANLLRNPSKGTAAVGGLVLALWASGGVAAIVAGLLHLASAGGPALQDWIETKQIVEKNSLYLLYITGQELRGEK